jgi:UDP-sugar transporter A1/2/3
MGTFFLQAAVFGLLVAQNTAIVLVCRWSKLYGTTQSSKSPLEDLLVITIGELLKFVTCFAIAAREFLMLPSKPAPKQPGRADYARAIFNWSEIAKISVPGLIYLVQNQLIFFSIDRLPGPVYQVTYQLKIVAAAVVARVFIAKMLSYEKWLALWMLTVGVAICNLTGGEGKVASFDLAEFVKSISSAGFLAAIGACFCSGLAGVYFEAVLKGGTTSLWVRNVHLAGVSILLAAGNFVYVERARLFTSKEGGIVDLTALAVEVAGELREFTLSISTVMWIVILLQAYGGILVSLVIKYIGTVEKAFAASMSILLTTAISLVAFPDFVVSGTFFIGAFLVGVSVYIYSVGFIRHTPAAMATKKQA